ncbi:hypothetical protein GCM10009804_51320 [Kribbella hippodromi]|uniref:HTH araC/xylS-type domain-containing protein n=1 Tax=Kribbella hippodromi TaxID=434347 RepID=A0ABN2DWL7_9ACTN
MHPWIEDVTLRSPSTAITVLAPDPAATVVWRMTKAGESDVLVVGPRTKADYHATKDLPVCVRLRIRPGRVSPLLGTAADHLVDRTIPLHHLCGPSAQTLAEQLTAYRETPEQAVEVLGNYLAARATDRLPGRLDLVSNAVSELTASPRVEDAAARLGVSERYLRRVFRQAVGLSPKQFARITRVRSVIAQARRPWADTAAYAGYADQSHLIADFRALMRVTPTAYATGKVPLSTC